MRRTRGVAARFMSVLPENICDRRQAVTRLRCRNVVNMAGLAKSARAVLNVSRVRVLSRAKTSEGLV